MTEVAAPSRRANKRGIATRESMIKSAITALATGDPGAVSGNRIARDIGATWGVVKYQFGDIDGLWAAVLRYTAEQRGDLPANVKPGGTLEERVTGLIEAMYVGLRSPESLAIETLRAALPPANAPSSSATSHSPQPSSPHGNRAGTTHVNVHSPTWVWIRYGSARWRR